MLERKFHHTDYPFSERDLTRTIKAADLKEGDWFLYDGSLNGFEQYYRITHLDQSSGGSMRIYFHGAPPVYALYSEDIIVVLDPTVPDNSTDPVQEMQKALVEIEEYVGVLRRNGKLDAVTNLLDTKASLLIAITEARRS